MQILRSDITANLHIKHFLSFDSSISQKILDSEPDDDAFNEIKNLDIVKATKSCDVHELHFVIREELDHYILLVLYISRDGTPHSRSYFSLWFT